ncbi:uncharacterized protein PV09_09552 [Verruconis gallopava]|uniref:Major facilitator superfamily (MFS) profile domain-containing protein n=1 Tax=Verruconis gallopava TaxID=253628 RepID=A0A0D1YD69_9PEZI|nr:uncharacterized protein PV09_09552 [Verruconis gallopava]KIV98671.1 hypothetical protein PV09_09552 [Verruconis gallopava]
MPEQKFETTSSTECSLEDFPASQTEPAATTFDPEKATSRTSPAAGPSPNDFPDGGWEAWLVVFGGFCSIFASLGWINCIGIFQDYYLTHQLSSYSASNVAWIPSTESFMMFFCAPLVGKATDQWGPRIPMAIGSFLHIFGLMMTSLSSKYYQFFLAQSIFSAMGCSFLFYPPMTACATWFLRHRALAIGIMVTGSSVGGVVLPIMVNRLVNHLGFGWTMRSLAFLLLGVVFVANLTVKSRLPPLKRPFLLKDFLESYKEPEFLLLTIGAWFAYTGGFLPFTFIVVQARAQGMSDSLAGYLVSILNAASTFGRVLPAWYGDKYGVFNIMILLTTLGAISNLTLWLPSTTLAAGSTNALIIVFTVLYGFASGCYFSILPATVAQISDVRKLGVRTGSLYVVASTGVLFGSPIAGVIASGRGNGFLGLTLFSGLTLLVAVGFVMLSRFKQVGFKLLVKC